MHRSARNSLPLALLLCAGLAWFPGGEVIAAEPRVTDDLLVLYRFNEHGGDVVHDRSEVGDPLDLQIDTPHAVEWGDAGLMVTSSARISSPAAARKVIDAVKQSGELTIEVWLTPRDDRQTGPARIVSLSASPSERNFTLGQDGGKYEIRLRTTVTNTNGIPAVSTGDKVVTPGKQTHLIYTRAKTGVLRIYLNGREVAKGEVKGDLSNWSGDYRLLLANELTGDRTWLGELHLVSLYGRALSAEEAARNFAAGLPAPVDYAALLPPPVQKKIDFVKDVQPILRARCFECHAQGNDEGGLNLSRRARVMEGGEHGPVLVRGKSAASRIVHRVAGINSDEVMPPKGARLTADEVGVLRAWIDQGADWPAGVDILDPRTEQGLKHWAFQPLRQVEPPAVNDQQHWVKTPIDQFILASLTEKGLTPTAPLGPRALMRRISFGVTGLPPTPDELKQFADEYARDADAAIAALADRLLATRHYGERWGRHWLDLARYADSDGYESDRDRPNAYHYRDFVIRALNDDLPYNTFVRWQLAGDEYEPQNQAAVAATGFLTGAPNSQLEDTFIEEERLRNRYNELDDMVSTTGVSLLGLTIGCARCHDHKYDAIASREYYRMLSALHNGERTELPIGNGSDKTLAFHDYGATPGPTWLFHRGDFYDHDQRVQLGFLQVLLRNKSSDDYWDEARQNPPRSDSSFQRKALAEWMTDVDHGAGPLLARVIVNRVWQHHFGEGLVHTVSDFGVRGEPPTHPNLLEWLASDLVEHGWTLKRLHRLIITSAVYQQGTTYDAAKAAIDPEDHLLWRRRPQRLEAEVLRDSMLAVSGTLNLEPYGPSFKPPISSEAIVARNLKTPYPADIKDTPDTHRRSVYMFHKRVVPYPLLQAFDRPDMQQSCGRRENTTVAPQALALLNDQFVRDRATEFADRLIGTAGSDLPQLVSTAFESALGRPPTADEQKVSMVYLDLQMIQVLQSHPDRNSDEVCRKAITDFCQTLFGLNEFLYVD